MRALIVAFYIVVGLFLISTMVYLAQSEKTAQPTINKKLAVEQPLKR